MFYGILLQIVLPLLWSWFWHDAQQGSGGEELALALLFVFFGIVVGSLLAGGLVVVGIAALLDRPRS